MCGKHSQWLGPKRRKTEFGNETAGTPRPGGNTKSNERKGYARGARIK